MANKGFFSGRLASAPTLEMHSTEVCRFTLIRNEYAGKDDVTGEAKESKKVSIQFVAFGSRGRAIAENVAKGDQLEVEYRIQNNNYTKEGEDVYGFNFVVVEFEFGAPGSITRERLAQEE